MGFEFQDKSVEIQQLWWEQPEDIRHHTIFGYVNFWLTSQYSRQLNNIVNMRQYLNREAVNLAVGNYMMNYSPNNSVANTENRVKFNKVNYNVIKSCIDTLHAKITKNKIKPTFLTAGGLLEQQTRAKDLNKALFGLFSAGGAYKAGSLAFRNACIFGDGFVKVFIDENKKVKYETVNPDELFVDPASSYYNDPQELYQIKFVSKNILLESFSDDEQMTQLITDCATVSVEIGGQIQRSVVVIEAWRKRIGKTNGKHLICIQNGTLFSEDWKLDKFPFARYSFTDPVIGFWAQGLAEELKENQREINKLLQNIQQAMHLMAYPRIFIERNSKINPNHIVNEAGTFVEYTGNPPIFSTPQSVAPEVFAHVQTLIKQAYDVTGVSQLSATSQKPSGLNSGRALNEYNDIQSERFYVLGEKYEQFYIDLANITCDILSQRSNYVVSTFSKDVGLETIQWKDIELASDSYTIQCFPSSALPTTPAARLQIVQDMLQGGFIQPEIAQDLLDFPDLEAYTSKQVAPVRVIVKYVEDILYKGEYRSPEIYMNLQLATATAQKYFNWAQLHEIDEDRVELLRQFIEDCSALINQAKEQAQQAQQAAIPAQQILQNQLSGQIGASGSVNPLQGEG